MEGQSFVNVALLWETFLLLYGMFEKGNESLFYLLGQGWKGTIHPLEK